MKSFPNDKLMIYHLKTQDEAFGTFGRVPDIYTKHISILPYMGHMSCMWGSIGLHPLSILEVYCGISKITMPLPQRPKADHTFWVACDQTHYIHKLHSSLSSQRQGVVMVWCITIVAQQGQACFGRLVSHQILRRQAMLEEDEQDLHCCGLSPWRQKHDLRMAWTEAV